MNYFVFFLTDVMEYLT